MKVLILFLIFSTTFLFFIPQKRESSGLVLSPHEYFEGFGPWIRASIIDEEGNNYAQNLKLEKIESFSGEKYKVLLSPIELKNLWSQTKNKKLFLIPFVEHSYEISY